MSANPIWAAYVSADPFSQLIFILLFLLSVGIWILMAWKGWVIWRAGREDTRFEHAWMRVADQPLSLGVAVASKEVQPSLEIYRALHEETTHLLERNRVIRQSATLTEPDLQILQDTLELSCMKQIDTLERYLFLLSTCVSLAPFLGLLGTVWGILQTFTELNGARASNEAFLGGLSTALATTVVGLVIAIPALVGHNYLRYHLIRTKEASLERFAQLMLSRIALAYRP